jgi:hypothetical protein
MQALRAAGFDFEMIRDDLDAQADRKHWHQPVPFSQSPGIVNLPRKQSAA